VSPERDDDADDEIGSDRFPFAIIPLGVLVLVAIVAGLLLADIDDPSVAPTGTTVVVSEPTTASS